MTLPAFDQLVRERFSGAARRYAGLCSLQNDIARELASRIPLEDGLRILDVGAGNGTLSSEILRRKEGLSVVGLDAAEPMVQAGRAFCDQAFWVAADAAALPFRDQSFDRVVSSSSYQWVGDLPAAFREARRVLKDDGRLCGAMFGRGTLEEMLESFHVAAFAQGREDVFHLRRLPSQEDVRAAFQKAGWQQYGVAGEKRTVVFRDLWGLLKWLQGIGANGLAKGFFLGKDFLARADEHYQECFSMSDGIRVSFEVLWIEGLL